MESTFEILIASLPDHHRVVAEIYFNGLFVLLISQERGQGLFDVETPPSNVVESKITRCADYGGLISAMKVATQRLSDSATS